MEESIQKIVFSRTFSYLSDSELNIAAKVCRCWWEIAKHEYRLRGPRTSCVTRNREKRNYRESWFKVKLDIIKNNGTNPCVQIFFSNDESDPSFTDKCHCDRMQSGSYSINLESNDWISELPMDNILISLAFPRTQKTKIATYTFILENSQSGLYCQELRFHCGTDIRQVKFLKTDLQSYFKNDSPTPSCMILFSSENSLSELFDLVLVLSSWFKESMITVWGGIVDSINVCRYCFRNHSCRINTEYTLIFISNPKLEVWKEILDENYNTSKKIKDKLRSLKRNVQLKIHSIALMYTSFHRIKRFYEIEKSSFKEVFPELTLFHMFGEAGFIGGGSCDLRDHFLRSESKIKNQSMHHETTIMIMTYD